MPVNPALSAETCRPTVQLGSSRRKGRPKKLMLSPCRSVVSTLKGTEVIHRTRKAVRSAGHAQPANTITNYFSPPAPPAPPAPPPAVGVTVRPEVREAAECPPAAGPPATPPQQGARRRRSCMEDAVVHQPIRPKRCFQPAAAVQIPETDTSYRESTPVKEVGFGAEAAGCPRTPVSPHKIQSLDCEEHHELGLEAERGRPRRAPLSPAAFDLNQPPKPGRKPPPARPARSKNAATADSAGPALGADADGNRKLTDYFPIRRSGRRTRRALEEEKSCDLRRRLRLQSDQGLKVALFAEKGRGVVAARPFQRGEFVVEYAGALVTPDQARQRERLYAQDLNTGCYMYYFTCHGRSWCIDGTAESERLGRLVNHSRLSNNCVTRSLEVDGTPRLALIAKQDIAEGEEILYDYGDRSKESLIHHPWLAF